MFKTMRGTSHNGVKWSSLRPHVASLRKNCQSFQKAPSHPLVKTTRQELPCDIHHTRQRVSSATVEQESTSRDAAPPEFCCSLFIYIIKEGIMQLKMKMCGDIAAETAENHKSQSTSAFTLKHSLTAPGLSSKKRAFREGTYL